jgi:hypothetical protein
MRHDGGTEPIKIRSAEALRYSLMQVFFNSVCPEQSATTPWGHRQLRVQFSALLVEFSSRLCFTVLPVDNKKMLHKYDKISTSIQQWVAMCLV